MSAARLAATRALVAVERGRTTLAAEIDRARSDLDARDRALLLELVAGTLRWQNELDACLQAVSRNRSGRLDQGVRATLRAAAYQLRHLDRVPVHAVVHESVEVVRAAGRSARRRLRQRRPAIAGAPPAHPAATAAQLRPADRTPALNYLTITLSHPEWLADRWLARYGFEAAERWCQFNNAAAAACGSCRRRPVRTDDCSSTSGRRASRPRPRPTSTAPCGCQPARSAASAPSGATS